MCRWLGGSGRSFPLPSSSAYPDTWLLTPVHTVPHRQGLSSALCSAPSTPHPTPVMESPPSPAVPPPTVLSCGICGSYPLPSKQSVINYRVSH